jgi:hypothetical protein
METSMFVDEGWIMPYTSARIMRVTARRFAEEAQRQATKARKAVEDAPTNNSLAALMGLSEEDMTRYFSMEGKMERRAMRTPSDGTHHDATRYETTTYEWKVAAWEKAHNISRSRV